MKLKKSLSLILAGLMLSGAFVSCGKKEESNAGTISKDNLSLPYEEASEVIYKEVLGEYYDYVTAANEKAQTVSERYAYMAIAEAKLLEACVMIPSSCDGGNYAIGRTVPKTVNFAQWGNDKDRYHNMLVTNEIIKSEDRDALNKKWDEVKGTGKYMEEAKAYLASKGYTLKDTYATSYSSDPQTWDVHSTSQAADSEVIIMTYDGLAEYDCEGTLQPALATSWEASDDGLKYTFHLREGVKWVDSQGREVGNLTADDFVAGLQHLCDAGDGIQDLLCGVIVNVTEYCSGDITDFTQVGIKAVDDYTLEYTLCTPLTYFTTMLGYGTFAPLNRAYYESQGGKFGEEFDSAAESYKYGVSPDTIAYCGPYLVSNFTSENTIVFSANPTYWNAENNNLKEIKWLFNDGTDALKNYNDMLAGTIDGAGLNSSALEVAKNDGNFDKYHYATDTGTTTFSTFYNVNRRAYANASDETAVVSELTDEQKTNAQLALANVHFRRALTYAFDRAAYNAQAVGEDLKLLSVRNMYTPGNFVELLEDVTVEINGKNTKFKAGTLYGEIVQAQIDADGVAIKAFDKKTQSSDGFDGYFNVENAKAQLELALAALKEQGLEVTKENPIVLDLPYPSNSTTYTNRANAYKQSLETNLDGFVKVNLVVCNSTKEWYFAGYYTNGGEEGNFHLYDASGWGPDFGDPCTYLNTFLPEGDGYMTRCIGLY